jgi:hypothetical protein
MPSACIAGFLHADRGHRLLPLLELPVHSPAHQASWRGAHVRRQLAQHTLAATSLFEAVVPFAPANTSDTHPLHPGGQHAALDPDARVYLRNCVIPMPQRNTAHMLCTHSHHVLCR